MTTTFASASPDDFDLGSICDDLADACQEYEDGLKASAAACTKMNLSIQSLQRWFIGYGIASTLAVILVALVALKALNH